MCGVSVCGVVWWCWCVVLVYVVLCGVWCWYVVLVYVVLMYVILVYVVVCGVRVCGVVWRGCVDVWC